MSGLIGAPTTERPVLFAANHISYTDITVLGSVIPGSFIAKAEVANWPFFGWLAKLQRSVFVDRKMRSTAIQRGAIAKGFPRGCADPVPGRDERRRQSRAPVQECLVRRGSAGAIRPRPSCNRFRWPMYASMGYRSGASIARSSRGTVPSIWRPICGA